MTGRAGDRPLVIGINAQLRSGEHGGVEQFVIGLASALSNLEDGAERYLFLMEPGEEGWLRPFVSGRAEIVTRLSGRRPIVRLAWAVRRRLVRTFPLLRRLRRTLRRAPGSPAEAGAALSASDGTLERAGADLIHFPFQSAFTTELPSIYHPWDLQHLHLPQFFSEEAIVQREREYRAFCDRAERVVVATDWAKRDFVGRYGLPSEKISVIPMPPPTAVYPNPSPEEVSSTARRLRLPRHFALYPAVTWEHKNHIRLLEALASVKDRHGMVVNLVCSGRRTERFDEIARTADQLELSDSVTFLGFVSPLDVRVLYRLARILVFPSLFEGWGQPVVEAMADGLPVACARVTSLPELVGDAAVLFDPRDVDDMADAIHRLWTDETLRKGLARRGVERVAMLDWSTCARQYRAQYRAVAGRNA